MITSLTIKNWRTHKNTTIEFGKGTNVIVGVMGSGKSSIVNAISYSLFGTFPALKARQVSLGEIIRNKPNKTEEAETQIEFIHNNISYLVERKIKLNGSNEAKLYKENKLIAGPKQKDVNEKVEHILELTYELFSRAVYAEQNEIDFFLKLSPSDRKKKFDELLELDKYEIARKNSLSLKNQLIKENKQKKEFVKQQQNSLEEYEEKKIKKQIQDEEQEIINLEKEINETQLNFIILEKKVKKLEEQEIIYKKLKEETLKKKTTIENLKSYLKNNSESNIEDILINKNNLKNKLNERIKEKEEIEKQKSEFDKGIKSLDEKNKIIEYRINTITKETREIITLEGKCPTCKQELTPKHKSDIENESKKEIELLNIDKKENEINKKELLEIKTLVDKKKINNEEELDKVKKMIYKNENEEIEFKEMEKKKKELFLLIEELPKKEVEIKEISFDEKELSKTKENYFENKSKKELIKSKIESKKELIQSHKSNLEKIEKLKRNINLLEKETKNMETASEKIGVFENCLISTQIELREGMLDTINNAMSNIWKKIYPYEDFIDARLCVVENGYDLQVLTQEENWIRVEGILSGGERSAAALCIRIAFALVLTKQLSMLILDEPTHNLDSNAVEKLSEMLRDSLPELVGQIFIITHDKQLENAASSNLYKLDRKKEFDEPTKIENIDLV